MSDLHVQIMNLPCNEFHAATPNENEQAAYGRGFKDARHQASELAAEHQVELQKQMEELQARIAMQDEALKDLNEMALLRIPDYEDYRLSDDVRDAISANSADVAAWQEKQLAPLRREVAMLAALANKAAKHVRPTCTELYTELMEGMMLTTATAEAYEKEVAAKALEEAAKVCLPCCAGGVMRMAAELRGETK